MAVSVYQTSKTKAEIQGLETDENGFSFAKKKKKPIARLIGQLRRVIILLPNISVRQNSPSSGAVKAK